MSHSHSHDGAECHGHSHSAAPADPELDKQFKEAAEKVRKEMSVPENAAKYSTEDKTKIYSLYKQASQGDVQGGQPWMFEFEARTKYDGWASLQGMSQEDAKRKYIALAKEKLGASW